MANDERLPDYYEILQISPNADPDTVHRVYRLMAQRYHPDNLETGDPSRFRQVTEAYQVLSQPESRAKYDVGYQQVRQERLQIVSDGNSVRSEFELEQMIRLTVLEALYAQRRTNPGNPGIFDLDMEALTGQSREHLEFTFWYLVSKNLIKRGDSSKIMITAEGVDHLETHFESTLQRKRLKEPSPIV